MFARRSKRVLTIGAVSGGLTLITAGAVAAAPSNPFHHDGGLIAACVGPDGETRITRTYQHCRPGEREIVWNEEGRPGIQGPTGAVGGTGPMGATGATGATGAPGPSLNTFNPVLQATGTTTDLTAVAFPFQLSDLTPVTGLQLTLPTAGTYLINANLRGILNFNTSGPTHNCYISADLATGATPDQVPGSLRTVVVAIDGVTTPLDQQATAPLSSLVTTTADNTVVLVRAVMVGSSCPNAAENNSIVTNADGASTINAVRIN